MKKLFYSVGNYINFLTAENSYQQRRDSERSEEFSCQKFLPIFILSAVTFFIYSFKLSAPFDSMDDQVLIVNNEAIVNFSQVKDILTGSFFPAGNYYRPGVLLSYLIEFHFFGLNAFFYNLDNILIHIFNVVLVFYLVERIWRERWISFLTALLFAVHPIHWEAVACVSGRPILLCGFFF